MASPPGDQAPTEPIEPIEPIERLKAEGLEYVRDVMSEDDAFDDYMGEYLSVVGTTIEPDETRLVIEVEVALTLPGHAPIHRSGDNACPHDESDWSVELRYRVMPPDGGEPTVCDNLEEALAASRLG